MIGELRVLAKAIFVAVLLLSVDFNTVSASESAIASPLAARSLLLDATSASSQTVVVGERGHILTSDDQGANWTQGAVPVRTLLTAVHLADRQTGWAVGHDAVILRTDDGGHTWQLLFQAPEEELPLLDVWFRDKLNGIAVGAYGYFLETHDGGTTWTSRIIDEIDYHLNRIAHSEESGRHYIAAEAGVIYRSDNGKQWEQLESPCDGSWFAALALPNDHLLVAGLRGHLFRTENAGDTWHQVDTGVSATLTDLVQLPSGRILITGHDGVILVSDDFGNTVSRIQSQSRQAISGVTPLAGSGNDVLIVGEFGLKRISGID